MANARPENSTSFDEDSPVEEHDEDIDDVFSNGKQNGGPPTRSVDRYGFIGGDHYTSPDEIPRLTLEMIRKREVKWIDMFENWEKWMTKRFKKVKARCRKGIPPSLRARAWQHLCGSSFLMNQNAGKFDEYLSKAGDPKWIEDIKKDLHRQFPLHEIFALRGGHGQEDLFRILKAYTVHNPQEGYCQAQGPIAAVLLMHMPAEQAFWCLVSICEKYLPGYYSLGLEAVHIDGDVLFGLLKKSSPLIYKHLKKQRIEPILYMTEWFMCIFSRTLPWTAVLRVWDMFFCEGVKVMFRIALILFKLTLGTPGKLSECPSLYETMDKLKHIPHQMIDGDFIARESLKLNIDEKDMEKEHQRQITKRRNLREKALKEASATKGKKEKKKLLGKLTKKDSESKLLQQQHQQTPANVMLISSQKLPETTQTAQPKMALPISASSPTVGQTTAVTTTTTNTTTTTGIPQRWSADLDAHSNINSHVLYASQISMEDESQRSVEQLPAEKFAHDEEQQVQETLAPVHSKSVLVPVEEIRQKLAGPEMMAPRAIEVIHATTAAVSEAVPARVLPIHLNEQAEVVTVSEAATSLHIEGVVEPTHADARHASDVAAPEVRMAMPQPQSPAEVNSIEVRPEESHSQTTCHTSPSDPTHSEPARSGAVTRAGGTQSDVAQPKPKSKSKSRKSKAVKIELVHSDGGGAKGVLSLGGGSDGDSHGARPTLTSFGQRSGSSGATSSSTSSSKSTVTRRTKTRTTEEERTSTTIVRRSMESGETTVMSTTMTSSMSSSSWKGKPESGDAPPEARPHSATFNNSFDGQWNIVEGTPVDSLHSTTVTTNITTTTSTKNTAVTAADGTTAVGDPTASALINSPTDTTPNNTTTTTTAINNNMTTTTEDKQATSPKSPNELSMNCDATSPTNLAAHDGLSEEDMLSLRESRL